MDLSFIQQLTDTHRERFTKALLTDAFFAPVLDMKVDRRSGVIHVSYLHTEVESTDGRVRYLLLFSHQSYWQQLKVNSPGLVQPPLEYLREELGDLSTVVDLGAPRSFTTTVDSLLSLRKYLWDVGLTNTS